MWASRKFSPKFILTCGFLSVPETADLGSPIYVIFKYLLDFLNCSSSFMFYWDSFVLDLEWAYHYGIKFISEIINQSFLKSPPSGISVSEVPSRESESRRMPGTSQGLGMIIYYLGAVNFHSAFLTIPPNYQGYEISPTVCSLCGGTGYFLPHSLTQNRGRSRCKDNLCLCGVFTSNFGFGWVSQGWRTGRGHSPLHEGWHMVLTEFLCEPGA